MANFINQVFGKKETPAATLAVPGASGTLLQIFLSSMPDGTQAQQKQRFASVMTNFEFGLFVAVDEIERCVQQSMADGFTVWANVDASSAFLYGAGLVQPDDFTKTMEWLRSVAVSGNIIFTGIHNPGEAMKLIEVRV